MTRPVANLRSGARAGYGVWLIVVHKARTIVFVPVFVLASLFALMVFLSALGASVRSCSCVLALSSAVGVGLAIGEVAVGARVSRPPTPLAASRPTAHPWVLWRRPTTHSCVQESRRT
jgi:hypothetical protein